jgi:hypothetical protein
LAAREGFGQAADLGAEVGLNGRTVPRAGAARYDAAFAGAMDRSVSGLAAICAEQLAATTLWAEVRDTPPASTPGRSPPAPLLRTGLQAKIIEGSQEQR